MEEVKRGDIVQFRGQAEDDLSAFLVLAVYSDGRVAVQEVSSRILKVERVVEASRLKVLF